MATSFLDPILKDIMFLNHIHILAKIWIAQAKLRQMINIKSDMQGSCHTVISSETLDT